MKTAYAALFGLTTLAMIASASAQQVTASATGGPFAGRSVAIGEGPAPRNPTPLFSIGQLSVGIWARVPPPYDAAANRTYAGDPLY